MKDTVKENSLLLTYFIIPNQYIRTDIKYLGFPAGDTGSIPELGCSPGEGSGNPLQYSCLENSLDRGACRAPVHRVTKEPDMT